ncbi:hypothetical protein ZIOFF_026369 [Zingiber officinale]|uniref:Uncharacterized protein n=1 Tax=Zingiber officinale TaxID=94328 RepID=A0A8J5H3X3_ZINOF|nr:hypothetical protein ZIOFF_026369 [Zingiber officinale]
MCNVVQGFRSSSNIPVDELAFVRKVEAKYPALLFKQQLSAYVEKTFGILRDNAKKELSSLISVYTGFIRLGTLVETTKPKQRDHILLTTSKAENQMKGRLLLDIVVGQGAAVLQLLAGKDEPLLVRGDAFLILDLCLHVIDGVGALDLQSNGLAGEGLHKDLHASPEPQYKVKGGLLLDVVVGEGAAVLQLLAGKDQPLLVRGDPFLILDLSFDIVDGVGALHLEGDGLASKGFDKDLHATTETEHEVEGRFLLDVVIGQGAAVLQLLTGKNQPLLVWGDPLLVLNLSFDIVNGVGTLHLEGDSLAGQGFNKDLHATTETENKVEGRLLLDVVIGQGAAVLELLTGEDQPLLVRRDPLLVLDLGLDVVDGIGRLDLKGDSLAGKGLDKDLHATTETKHEVEGGLFLDVVVGKSAAVLELLAGKDQPLLIRRDPLLVLDLGLHVVDSIRRLDLKGDRLSGESFNEDLHASTETQNEVEGGLFLDVVVGKGAAVLELLAGEDQPLLIRRDPLLVLDLGFYVVNGIRRLYLKGNRLAGESFNEDLHLLQLI